jgi:hypothetical protein
VKEFTIIFLILMNTTTGFCAEVFRVDFSNSSKEVITPKLQKETKTSLVLNNNSIADLKITLLVNSNKVQSFNLLPNTSTSYPLTVGPKDKITLVPFSPPSEIISFGTTN